MSIETNILNWIRLALTPMVVLFRNNIGVAIHFDKSGEKKYFVPYGVGPQGGGGSDSIGWTTKIVTPEMVGKPVAIFTAIETKRLEGEATSEQINFVKQVRAAGGYAGFANCREDARKIVGL